MAERKTLEQKIKERGVKNLQKHLVQGSWYWRGPQFMSFGWFGATTETSAYVTFIAKFHSITARIETEDKYKIPNQVCMFGGDDAMADAVNWTVDRLIDLYKILTERTAPYAEGHYLYQKAIKGD